MISQIIAKTKWFLRDTSPLTSLLIFLSIVLIVWSWLYFIKRRKNIRSVIYSVVFSLSLTLIVMFTLLRKPETVDYGFDKAFSSLPSAFVFNSEQNIVFKLNILLFIPFALALRSKVPAAATVVTCVVLSICIEMIQMIYKLGIFEFSDILGNSLGSVIGVWIYILGVFVIKYIREKRYQTIFEKIRGIMR